MTYGGGFARERDQLSRMAEKYARFDRLVAEHLQWVKTALSCPACGQMCNPDEQCRVCARGKK